MTPLLRPLVLIRHAESTKNLNPKFSDDAGDEQLTDKGKGQTADLGTALRGLSAECGQELSRAYVSPTERAFATAAAIGDGIALRNVDDFRPIRSPYPGESESDVAAMAPTFMMQVQRYRAGLVSAYQIPRGSGENIREFEDRVEKGLKVVLDSPASSLAVVIGHRSTITAILLRAARQVHSYPNDWYGHVEIPLASVSVLVVDQEGVFVEIRHICIPPKSLVDRV